MSERAEDIEAKARIRANSRLNPAKDIHVAFSELASSVDPERFEELKARLILAIDSAEAEFKILSREVDVLSSLTEQWKAEMSNCDADQLALQAELVKLDEESDVIAGQIAARRDLENKKEQLIREDLPNLTVRIEETKKSNEDLANEIEATKATNERRSVGFDEALAGFRKFLLVETENDVE